MKHKIILIPIILFLYVFTITSPFPVLKSVFNPASSVMAAEKEDDEEDPADDPEGRDEDAKLQAPKFYLPRHPEVKKFHLQAMELAEEFTRILAERSRLQPELGRLESEEANMRHLMLKYRLHYYKTRERIMAKNGKNPAIQKALMEQDRKLLHVDELIYREEKIDCLHTIYERKHRSMEEYHWKQIDDKHPLIAEYLQDRTWEKNSEEIKALYGEMISDYQRIIRENKEIMAKTKEIIEEKKNRVKILKLAVKELNELSDEGDRMIK